MAVSIEVLNQLRQVKRDTDIRVCLNPHGRIFDLVQIIQFGHEIKLPLLLQGAVKYVLTDVIIVHQRPVKLVACCRDVDDHRLLTSGPRTLDDVD
ncbi:hypothetical protein D3C84_996260 [compost metagenome]